MIRVCKVLGLATLQDLGRVGRASQGVPRGGALVRSLARCANAALGNADGAACIEIFGRVVFTAERDVRIATEDGAVRALRANEDFVIEPSGSLRARYVAVEGGIDAPRVLGSRSSFLGASLHAGDVLACGNDRGAPREWGAFETAGPLRIIVGPDNPEAGIALTQTSWRIDASSNRHGTRLEGARITHSTSPSGRASRPSSPMIVGAIQLPPSGLPIVIGPDGPTTGGYALIAAIVRADLDRFHARPLGASITFVRA